MISWSLSLRCVPCAGKQPFELTHHLHFPAGRQRVKLRLVPRVAAGEQRSAPARILADARPAPVPREARAGAAAWAPWAWRAQDANVLAEHARRAAVDILPRVRLWI